MHWFYLLLAIALLLAASKAAGWLVLLLVIGSLVLFVAWMLGWVNSRISSGARNDMDSVDRRAANPRGHGAERHQTDDRYDRNH